MKLAHTGNDRLACFLIGMLTESRIFLSQLGQCFRHLALTGFGPGLDRQLDNGFRELHGFKDYRVSVITDGIAGSGELQSYRGSDITGIDHLQFLSLVRVHLKDTSDSLFLILRRV